MKSPNARFAYAYGPPVRGRTRPRFANTSARAIAPAPVNSQPRMDTGPAELASDAGSRKMPEPIMLPTTSAVAIQSPIDRLSLRSGAADGAAAATSVRIASPPCSGGAERRRFVVYATDRVARPDRLRP